MTDQPDQGVAAPADAQPAERPAESTAVQGCLIALPIAALPFYLFSFLGMFEPDGPDGGIGTGLAVLAEIPLWIALSLSVMLATGRAQLSTAQVVAVLAFVAAAALASAAALGMMWTHPDWRVVAPLVLPPLAAAFGYWLRRADRLASEARRRGLLAFAGATFVLVAPIAASWQRQQAERAALDRQADAEEARRAAAFETAMRAPDRRFERLAPWLDDECPCDNMGFNGMTSRAARAAEAIRALASRQADAVRLLDSGFSLASLARLHQLGLEATPELCRAYTGALERKAGELVSTNPQTADAANELRLQTDNLYWLAANGCDLSATARRVTALEQALGPAGDTGLGEAMTDTIRSGVAAGPPPCAPTAESPCQPAGH